MCSELVDLIKSHLHDPLHAWSVGTLGAIGEFTRDDGEPAQFAESPSGIQVTTPRGGLSIELNDQVRPVAHEALSGRKDRWLQGLTFCLSESEALMSRRSVLTDLGPDQGSLNEGARGSSLFDIGLAASNIDVCVRVDDSALDQELRRHLGKSTLTPDSPAMQLIKEASPTRIFLSRIARLEVYQRIGSRSRGLPTPEGPHTHVLPGLLAKQRTHTANSPIPEGYLPVLDMHPANPVSTLLGKDRAFDQGLFDHFQDLIARFPPNSDYLADKRRIDDAVRAGSAAESFQPAETRIGRKGQRITLRQLRYAGVDNAVLAPWLSRFDRTTDGDSASDHH